MQQSVKDVLQSLVDDGLVTVEKIGTSNYYWSFPSDVQQKVAPRCTTCCSKLLRFMHGMDHSFLFVCFLLRPLEKRKVETAAGRV